jgi:hypothetical protein
MQRVLFLAKKGQTYSDNYGCTYFSSGLRNSAQFVVDMLKAHRVDVKFVQVVDNNDIDREVFQFRPDVVILEALWVVPEKFEVLRKLHPGVKWVVRIHSEIPFLAQEGVAIQWIFDYLRQPNVFVGFNSSRTLEDFDHLTYSDKLVYLPNYFPLGHPRKHFPPFRKSVDIGCFGAIRPLKNQLIQAVAAIRYAELMDKHLRFHINSSRVERGQDVLKNLRALFENTDHRLIEHKWLTHSNFVHLVAQMDVSMCVSFSESFCIVAADSVSAGVPLVCSPEIRWASQFSQVEPTSVQSIVRGLFRVTAGRSLVTPLNRRGLENYNRQSVTTWLKFLG